MARRQVPAPYTNERDPLELIARLLVPGSYKVPVEGRSTRAPLQACDVAGAVGMMRDRLAQQTTLAVVTRAPPAEVARLSRTAYRRVLHQVRNLRPSPIDLTDAADRWRLRLVIYDAAYELVWPEARRPFGALAAEAKMRKARYMAVHRAATAVLQETLADGRRELRRRLFGAG